MSDTKLRAGLIRLAHANPGLREALLPLLRSASKWQWTDDDKEEMVKVTEHALALARGGRFAQAIGLLRDLPIHGSDRYRYGLRTEAMNILDDMTYADADEDGRRAAAAAVKRLLDDIKDATKRPYFSHMAALAEGATCTHKIRRSPSQGGDYPCGHVAVGEAEGQPRCGMHLKRRSSWASDTGETRNWRVEGRMVAQMAARSRRLREAAKWIGGAINDVYERQAAELLEATAAKAEQLGLSPEAHREQIALKLLLDTADMLVANARKSR